MVADWLLRHPTVTVVARDRAGAYSDAVQSAAPAAQQVADRWHLLSNLREVVERLLMRQSAKLREAARLVGQALYVGREPLRADNGAKVLALTIWQRLGIDRRAARLALYEEAVRQHNLGETFKAIGRAMNLDQRTISNFIRSGSFPERAQRTRVTRCSTLIVNTSTSAPQKAASADVRSCKPRLAADSNVARQLKRGPSSHQVRKNHFYYSSRMALPTQEGRESLRGCADRARASVAPRVYLPSRQSIAVRGTVAV